VPPAPPYGLGDAGAQQPHLARLAPHAAVGQVLAAPALLERCELALEHLAHVVAEHRDDRRSSRSVSCELHHGFAGQLDDAALVLRRQRNAHLPIRELLDHRAAAGDAIADMRDRDEARVNARIARCGTQPVTSRAR
jgi:hypothetical protein